VYLYIYKIIIHSAPTYIMQTQTFILMRDSPNIFIVINAENSCLKCFGNLDSHRIFWWI